LSFTEVNPVETLSPTQMRTFDITFKIFGWTFSFYLDIYPAIKQDKWFEYGSTNSFGKWKTSPYGLPVNPYNMTKKKRKKK
jgi:hypothetical protein